MLREKLKDVLENWQSAKKEAFSGHRLGRVIRNELVQEIENIASTKESAFVLKGSIGAGNWADVPWVSILHSAITQTTQGGIYPVYLFCADGSGVYLSLNQGTTKLKEKFGTRGAKHEAKKNADSIYPYCELLLTQKGWTKGPLDLKAKTITGKSYEEPNVVAKFYPVGSIPSEQELISDLDSLLSVYENIAHDYPLNSEVLVEEPKEEYDVFKNNVYTNAAPLNQILYGPPGTGKTYHTIEAAVQAADPDFYASINIDPETGVSEEQRGSLTKKYKALTAAGRIRFVTFHQSYGYEEFVEGLSAKTEGGQISYYEKEGVFKALCEKAKDYQETKTTDEKDDFDTLWGRFLNSLSEQEEGVRIDTVRTFFIVTDVDNNTICFEKDKGESTHSLSVKTLKDIFHGDRVINGGLNPYYSALIKHLEKLAHSKREVKTERQNYVLVIDEINRGNISKIFGELITLIEPSKRKGAQEPLEVILPYSGDTFSVPDNLYIIGTMNTADRSLAMMDTALRRRFDFKEMMPNPKLFADKEVKGINLSKLLETLNKRIEVLYDREHTLGHAFLFPVFNEVDEGKAFIELQSAFKNKIIPLLEEYFYEDWSKIRLVLGDSLKQDERLQFLKRTEDSYSELFGPEHGLELYEDCKVTYSFKPFGAGTVWQNPAAFKAIYAKDSE
ncbi:MULTISPECIES: MrcB family domain-containing protein [unclassified Vibrio]|uniref:MrcB family domain-containing protein n=1 Tax=unclassified Vibrio TaxID=2614977 RepID=UPI003552E891